MLAAVHDNVRVADAGPRHRAPERTCAATRTVKPVDAMIRYVVAPDGTVVPDVKRKLPGRGIWVTATRHALTQAIKRKAFGAGFKRSVKVDGSLVAVTERLLEQAALDALAICSKASLAVAGFVKVETALRREPVVALLHASGAAADGVRKLDAALQRRFGEEANRVRIIADFSSNQLDLALARPNVVHAALLTGPASDTFLARHARLTAFRAGGDEVSDHRAVGSEDWERNE
jgi:predicted RNA-binding protein YlxR (DUF448 family)